jgi:putative oxidoreductase
MNGENGRMPKVVLSHLAALGVAAYFLYAAHEKILDPRQFAVAIKNYKMVPEMFVNLMALFMPWWEVGGAVALVIPRTRRAGAIIISALLLVFIIAISYAALYKGLDIECGCLGKNSSKAGWSNIILDVGLLIAAAGAVYLPARGRSPAAEPCAATLATDRGSS